MFHKSIPNKMAFSTGGIHRFLSFRTVSKLIRANSNSNNNNVTRVSGKQYAFRTSNEHQGIGKMLRPRRHCTGSGGGSRAFSLAKLDFCSRQQLLAPAKACRRILRNWSIVAPKIPKYCSPLLLSAGFLSFLGFKGKEEEDELVQAIKLAVISIQKGELNKAEQILHVALKMAQDKMEQQGITYIYDMLANIAYQKHEYKKAEKLFVETVRRLLASGKPDTDNAIVEISIKLADIYSSTGDCKKAEDGFLYSINTLETKLEDKQNESDKDLHLLLGMASEMYAHHLLENSRLQKSKTFYESALEISKKINGPKHPQTLVLLNDLGGVCSLLHEYDIATDYLKQAIDLGIEVASDDLPAFYCNMGAIYFKLGNLSQAGAMCKQAHLLATKFGNKVAEKDALACLDDVKQKSADGLKADKVPEKLE